MIGRTIMITLAIAGSSFIAGAVHSSFKHYYARFAEEEDLNDGTVTKVAIVSDETKSTRGRKK